MQFGFRNVNRRNPLTAGGGGGGVGVFGTTALSLASATLSGGARITGAGATARITTAQDKFFTSASMGNSAATRNGVAFDPDGLHFWIVVGTTAGASTGFRKIRISDGAVITTITGNATDGGTRVITSPQGLTRRGNKIYTANAGAGNYLCEYDMVGNVCRMYSQATVTAPSHVVSDGTNLWARTSAPTTSATYQEFTLSGTGDTATATATARTVASAFEMVVDNAGTFAYFMISTAVTRFKLSDGTTTTFTPAANLNLPGYTSNALRGAIWDPIENKLVVRTSASTDWWYVNSTFDGAEKRFMGLYDLGGPISEVSTTNFARAAVAWSDDGTQVAMASLESGATATTVLNVRVRNIGVQRARWSWTATATVTLQNILVPGDLGLVTGTITDMPSTPAYFATAYDQRKTKIYYAVNGGARTEYRGQDLSQALTVGDVLTVDADMQHAVAHSHFLPPTVGGNSGEGIRLFYS